MGLRFHEKKRLTFRNLVQVPKVWWVLISSSFLVHVPQVRPFFILLEFCDRVDDNAKLSPIKKPIQTNLTLLTPRSGASSILLGHQTGGQALLGQELGHVTTSDSAIFFRSIEESSNSLVPRQSIIKFFYKSSKSTLLFGLI